MYRLDELILFDLSANNYGAFAVSKRTRCNTGAPQDTLRDRETRPVELLSELGWISRYSLLLYF